MIGKVYILQAGNRDLFKIGHTYQSTQSRIQQIQTGCPYPLNIHREIETFFPEDLEKLLHQLLAEYRTNGEWFEMPPSEINSILDTPMYEPFTVTLAKTSPVTHETYITLNSYTSNGEEIYLSSGCVTAGELQYQCLQLIKSLLKIYLQAGKFTSIDERGGKASRL